MLEREQITAFFIAILCMAMFFIAMYITFPWPEPMDMLDTEYEIDGYLYNCKRIIS
jgi:hypothetical protein